ISRVEDIEALVKVGIVGLIPMQGKVSSRQGLATVMKGHKSTSGERIRSKLILGQNEGSIFLESFRILGANVQVIFGVGGRIKNKIIMITGSNPREGKSLISSNLSVILAQMGYDTLLVDTDIRKPDIETVFGLKEKTGGLTDVLLGKYELEEIGNTVIRNATDLMLGELGVTDVLERPWLNNLHILTAGTVAPNPVHLFHSNKLDETMQYLRQKYDVVILDTAPILLVSDPIILAPKVDGALLVYRVGMTSRITLRRAKARIESIRGKQGINGLILNNVIPKLSMESYASYYHKEYYLHDGNERKHRG
ncbi:MAG: CpsD/CapB family tyrosine-protein kinase, partial [Candidatus Omnitrophota bacterium]